MSMFLKKKEKAQTTKLMLPASIIISSLLGRDGQKIIFYSVTLETKII